MASRKKKTPEISGPLRDLIESALEDDKAEDVVVIDLAGKTSIADFMIVASGGSKRHIAAIADHLIERIKQGGHGSPPVEGMGQCDWVLVDAGDVIVHLFRPEVRAFYNLEKMWEQAMPELSESEASRAGGP